MSNMLTCRPMKRRAFIAALGGVAAWPLIARAQQQPSRMRRVGVVMSNPADDALGQTWHAAFIQGLQQLGWEVGSNVRIETRWGAGDTALYRKYAAELVASAPDVVLATANSIVGDLQQLSRTVPIVFVTTVDPVGSGLVASLARPGGNATGFIAFEFSLNAKVMELLKGVAPGVTRIAVIRDPSVTAGSAGFAAVQTAVASSGVELVPIGVRDADEIVNGIRQFAHGPSDGLVVVGPPSSIAAPNRDLIVRLAIERHLPATYATLAFVPLGGLISYGSDQAMDFRRAAGYVDRILNGQKPADLPVQAPTKYKLIVNLKTAKAIGLSIPASILATADEVIE
jgi:putative tryptophan/tyrosine transport system substrate-binding protein